MSTKFRRHLSKVLLLQSIMRQSSTSTFLATVLLSSALVVSDEKILEIDYQKQTICRFWAVFWGVMLSHAVPLSHWCTHTGQTTLSSSPVTPAVCATHSWVIAGSNPTVEVYYTVGFLQVTLSLVKKSMVKVMENTSYEMLLFNERVK